MNIPPPPPDPESQTPPRSLRRPNQDRMIAGVAAGFAEYLDIDVTIVRIAIAVLVVVGGAGIALYIAGLLLMPAEGSDRSIAQRLIRSRRASSN